MTDDERARLLDAMASVGTETDRGERATFLMPRAAKRLLDPGTVVIVGARGSGKSALARFLVDAGSKTGGAATRVLAGSGIAPRFWFDAFSQHGTLHPDAMVLDDFVRDVDDDMLRGFWLKWLVLRFLDAAHALPEIRSGSTFDLERLTQAVGAARRDPAKTLTVSVEDRVSLVTQLDDLHDGLASAARNKGWGNSEPMSTAVYDDLDLVGGFDPLLRARFVRALLTMWASFSTRYPHLRAKIFLPADLFDLRHFDTVDVSKLFARAERLEWDTPSLYRLVLRHLGQRGEDVRAWLQGFGIGFRDEGDGIGWMPDEPTEAALDSWLSATLRANVAVNGTRSSVQRWIPNRLRDGKDRVAPRSMLDFFRVSARIAQSRPPSAHRNHLLTVSDAVESLGTVGANRVTEIRAVYEWVDRLLALRGRTMPMARSEVEALVAADPPGSPKPTRARDGRTVTDELIRLGLLRELRAGEDLDLPDLFVPHFGVLRGVRAEAPVT